MTPRLWTDFPSLFVKQRRLFTCALRMGDHAAVGSDFRVGSCSEEVRRIYPEAIVVYFKTALNSDFSLALDLDSDVAHRKFPNLRPFEV